MGKQMSYSTENYEKILFIPETLKCWVGVQRGQSSWGEGASLALVTTLLVMVSQ